MLGMVYDDRVATIFYEEQANMYVIRYKHSDLHLQLKTNHSEELDKRVIDAYKSSCNADNFYDRYWKPYADAFGSSLKVLEVKFVYRGKRIESVTYNLIWRTIGVVGGFEDTDLCYMGVTKCTYNPESLLKLPVEPCFEQIRGILVFDNEPCDELGEGVHLVLQDKLSLLDYLFSKNGVEYYASLLPAGEQVICLKALIAGQEPQRIAVRDGNSIHLFYENDLK